MGDIDNDCLYATLRRECVSDGVVPHFTREAQDFYLR